MTAPAVVNVAPEAPPALLKPRYQREGSSKGLRPKKSHCHPRQDGGQEDGSVLFIGTATTVIEWEGVRILTDPNFLHSGDHVHLGPGVSATRRTDPAVDLHELPPVHVVLLSHYHEDHFDKKVEESLDRAFPIITTKHGRECLTSSAKPDPFRNVQDLDPFESLDLRIRGLHENEDGEVPTVRVTGMPGKHVPPGPISVANDLLQAVPPTNGWVLELGRTSPSSGEGGRNMKTGYRIYITGDTLFVDELRKIPEWLQNEKIDLMLIHLGGTTIPGPSLPLVMVTMDAKQGMQVRDLVDPDVTVPIHYDDYDVFLSPLEDFKKEARNRGLEDRVVYLDRGEEYRFTVEKK